MPVLSRRDQAQAHRFLARRLAGALIRDDPDAPDAPMRKLATATFASVMVAVLAVAGFGVLGLLRPGGATSWKDGQSLIIEKETGTRYLYTGGRLHPVLNYASARLALGQATLSIVSVSAASLGGTPRGLPIGIPGAPDELPTPSTLVTGHWSVCSLPSADAAGRIHPYVRVTAGQAPGGPVLAGDRGLLAAASDGTSYLVWDDHRLRVPGGTAALTALGYASATPLPVGDAWLSALPQGPDLAVPQLAAGDGVTVGGSRYRIGQVFDSGGQAGTGAGQYYVMLGDGLAPVTATEADLLLAAAAAGGYPGAVPVTAAEAAAIRSGSTVDSNGLPARPPALADPAGGQLGVCESYYPGAGGVPVLWTVAVPSSAMPAAAAGAGSGAGQAAGALGVAVADQVRVAPGGGVVAQAVPAPGVSGGTLYLVSDQGLKYPLPDASVLGSLGLGGASPVRLPALVLDLLPTGPKLDPQAALRTATP